MMPLLEILLSSTVATQNVDELNKAYAEEAAEAAAYYKTEQKAEVKETEKLKSPAPEPVKKS